MQVLVIKSVFNQEESIMIDLNSVKLKSFEKLPQDWVCLYCESSKEHFGDQIVQTMYAPNQAEVYIRRGKLYMEKGEIAFAKQDFQTAVKIDGTRLNEVKAYI